MKHLKTCALASAAAMLSAVSDVSATILEVGGTAKNESTEITASLASGTSTTLKTTGGLFANTCTESHANGSTESPYSGFTVGGPLSSLSFGECSEEKVVVAKRAA